MLLNRMRVNGAPATLSDLAVIAQINYGHFTSLQVRAGRAQGFDLHLARLATATEALFGQPLDLSQTREWIREAIADEESASLRVTVFSRALDRTRLERALSPDVLVAVTPRREANLDPVSLRSIVYQRELPTVKHVGTFGLFHHLRQARIDGFDDVLFTTPLGEISEGSIWNIGFWDGSRVTWPSAPALDGISRQLLDAALRNRGVETSTRAVHRSDLSSFRAAFTTNSGAVGRPIARIDDVSFAADPQLSHSLMQTYAACEWQQI